MKLTAFIGPMFSGKTNSLLTALGAAKYSRRRIGIFKSSLDTRYSNGEAVSHDGLHLDAIGVEPTDEGAKQILDTTLEKRYDMIGIDEIQFFPPTDYNLPNYDYSSTPSIVKTVLDLLENHGKDVYVTGLNLNFRGEPWPVVQEILPYATRIISTKAYCAVCGNHNATRTQRLGEDRRPSRYDEPVVVVGGKNMYQARCISDHEVPDRPKIKFEMPVAKNL